MWILRTALRIALAPIWFIIAFVMMFVPVGLTLYACDYRKAAALGTIGWFTACLVGYLLAPGMPWPMISVAGPVIAIVIYTVSVAWALAYCADCYFFGKASPSQ